MDKINAVNSFSGTTVPYRRMWETIEARICALKKEESYHLLSTRIFLTAEEFESRRVLVEHESLDIAMWMERIPISYLDELLYQLRDAKTLTIGERSLNLNMYENSTEWGCEKYSGRYRGYLELEYPYITLHTNATSLDKIDWNDIEKQLNRFGYNSLRETAFENLGFHVGGAYTPQIVLAAPIYLKLKGMNVQNNSLVVSVESHNSAVLADMSLSYEIKYEQDEKIKTLNQRVSFSESDIREHEGRFQVLKKEINADGKIVEARTWLHDKWTTEPIDSDWIRQERTPREGVGWRILSPLLEEKRPTELIDGHRQLRRYLCLDYYDPTLGNYFEFAVSYLLGSMGFSIFFLGKPVAKKGIDIVAICPDSNKALVVSVHISNDVHEKLRTLLPELNRLRNTLQDIQIVPVIFLPVNYEDLLKSDRMDARAGGVGLILRTHIEELFNIASRLVPAEARRKALELFDRLLGEQMQDTPNDII